MEFNEKNNLTKLNIGKYKLLEIIGKGAMGEVYKSLDTETGKTVAIKQIELISIKKKDIELIESEIKVLKTLSHPNIVKYLECIITKTHINVILEYIENGSLSLILKKSGKLKENLVLNFSKQILNGLSYLHSKGIMHRDIKGGNLLLTKEGIVKLADFGYSILNDNNKGNSLVGTAYWMAPEVIEQKGGISSKCDIWSLGCTIIQLLTEHPPYYDFEIMAALFRIVTDKCPPLPNGISTNLKDFLKKCFVKNPENRPSANDLLNHPWIASKNSILIKSPKNKTLNQNLNRIKHKRNFKNTIGVNTRVFKENITNKNTIECELQTKIENKVVKKIGPKIESKKEDILFVKIRDSFDNSNMRLFESSNKKSIFSLKSSVNENCINSIESNTRESVKIKNSLIKESNKLLEYLNKSNNNEEKIYIFDSLLNESNNNSIITVKNSLNNDYSENFQKIMYEVNNINKKCNPESIILNEKNKKNTKDNSNKSYEKENIEKFDECIKKLTNYFNSKNISKIFGLINIPNLINLFSFKYISSKSSCLLLSFINIILIKYKEYIEEVLVHHLPLYLYRIMYIYEDIMINKEILNFIKICLNDPNNIKLFVSSGGVFLILYMINNKFLDNNEDILIICLNYILYILKSGKMKQHFFCGYLINHKLMQKINLLLLDINSIKTNKKKTDRYNKVNDIINNKSFDKLLYKINLLLDIFDKYNKKFEYLNQST